MLFFNPSLVRVSFLPTIYTISNIVQVYIHALIGYKAIEYISGTCILRFIISVYHYSFTAHQVTCSYNYMIVNILSSN